MVRRAHHDNVDKLRLFTGASILKKKDKQKLSKKFLEHGQVIQRLNPSLKKLNATAINTLEGAFELRAMSHEL